MIKDLIILGSTGSIGRSTIDIVKRNKSKFKIKLLSTNSNVDKIYNQSVEFNVRNILIKDKKK